MNRFVVAAFAFGALALAAPSAAAQAPPELPLPAFLEKRVPEELAVEGHLLSRQNLGLKIEAAGAILIVSLVDLDSGRVAASTKVDQVPADREAAVAFVTHVAADLVTQLAGRPQVSEDTKAALDAQRAAIDQERKAREDDHRAAEAKELATLKYQKEMIRFGNSYDVIVSKNSATVVKNWVPYRGELDQELPAQEFYKLVGHPELAEAYERRHNVAIGGLVVGIGAMAATFGYLRYVMNSREDCTIGQDFDACFDRNEHRLNDALVGTLILAGVSGVGIGVYTWYHYHPHPISETDAKSMAALYNDGLRQNLGLPVVQRHLIRDLTLRPYVAGNEGGLSLSARF